MTDSHTPTELRPCPFCGGDAKIWNYPDVVLGCTQCRVHIKAEWYDGDLGTMEASWNRRGPENSLIEEWKYKATRCLHNWNMEGKNVGNLISALRRAGQQFRFYERNHREKNTPDGNEKAGTNANFAEMCEKEIASAENSKINTSAVFPNHHQLIQELVGALEGVIAVADRKTNEFDRAHAVLQTTRERMGGEKS